MGFPPIWLLYDQFERNLMILIPRMSSVFPELEPEERKTRKEINRKTTETDRAQEARSKPASQHGCWPHAEARSGGGEWERSWLTTFSSGPPSWENCPPLGQIYPSTLKARGLRLHEEGLCHGQVLTPWQTRFVWALGRNKYHLTGWALRTFYIIDEGLLGVRFSLSLKGMISYIIFTAVFFLPLGNYFYNLRGKVLSPSYSWV